MSRMRRFGAAIVLAGTIAAGLAISSARLQARGPGSGGSQSVLCKLLASVVNNTSLDVSIREAAWQTYTYLHCQPALPEP